MTSIIYFGETIVEPFKCVSPTQLTQRNELKQPIKESFLSMLKPKINVSNSNRERKWQKKKIKRSWNGISLKIHWIFWSLWKVGTAIKASKMNGVKCIEYEKVFSFVASIKHTYGFGEMGTRSKRTLWAAVSIESKVCLFRSYVGHSTQAPSYYHHHQLQYATKKRCRTLSPLFSSYLSFVVLL